MVKLLTLADVHNVPDAESLRTWLRGMKSVRIELRAQGLDDVPAVDVDEGADPALARVNHGQWIADCPTPGCSGAMLLNPGQPYLCGSCLNAQAGHRWRRVEWPADGEDVEAALKRQPMTALRNWEPGVSAVALKDAVDAELRGEKPRHVRTLRAVR